MVAVLGARVARVLSVLVALACLATALASAPSAAAAKDPSKDYPKMPARCLGPGQIIPYQPQACMLTKLRKDRPIVVLWGDSHAWQHIPPLRAAARAEKVNLVAFVFGTCPPFRQRLRKSGNYGHPCELNNALAQDWVKRAHRAGYPVRVVLGGHWYAVRWGYHHQNQLPAYKARISRLFHRKAPGLFRFLGRHGISTHVIGQAATVPFTTEPPRCGHRHPYTCKLPRSAALPAEDRTERWLRARMRALSGEPRLIEVNRRFCNARVCRGRKNGIYTFYDDIHLSASRTRTTVREFRPTVRGIG